jgi:hypothetical protein
MGVTADGDAMNVLVVDDLLVAGVLAVGAGGTGVARGGERRSVPIARA